MALLIIVAAIVGLYGALGLHYGVSDSETALKIKVITIHKDIASVTLFLIVLRILWRVTHRPPALTGMSPLMVMAAHLGHILLYALMIIVPVLGWANSSSAGYEIPVAGLFTIPALVAKNPQLTPMLSEAHAICAYLLLLVVIGHIGFALKHRFIDRDNVMQAMLP